MSFCSLCRVPATPEHKIGGWHSYNENLQAQGKMPMSKDLYDKFESHKYSKSKSKPKPKSKSKSKSKSTLETTLSSTSLSSADSKVNKKNANSWHWEEKNCMPWAKTRITEMLKGAKIPLQGNGSLSITAVDDIKGDAYLNIRKGKLRVGFEITIGKIKWEGEIQTDAGISVGSCAGTCSVPEFCEDADDDDYDVTSFKLDDDTDNDDSGCKLSARMKKQAREEAREVLLTTMKKKGKKVIIEQLKLWSKEMHAKKDAIKA